MITKDGLPHADYVRRWATFSDCMTFRYILGRLWDESLPLFVYGLLNPSTADEDASDPTNTRCERRTKALGGGGQIFVNAFGLRSVTPKALYDADDPIGPDNDDMIRDALSQADRFIAGWGVHGAFMDRGQSVAALARDVDMKIETLGLTKDGHPRHPLYVAYKVEPQLWLA